MRVVVRVLRLPPPFLGGRLWRGGVRVLPLVGCAPPPPLWFFFGRGFVVSVAGCPGVGSRGLCPPISSLPGCVVCCLCFFFLPSVVCVRVFCVSLLPVGRCPRLGVAGFGRVVRRRPFGGSCLRCPLGGGFGRLLWCWWAAWWLWVVLAPLPPSLLFFFLFFGGGVYLFLPLPSLDWRTHWLAFCVVFRFAVGGCVLPGPAPAPWVGWVMYTLRSAPLPAGLGSGSAVVPGGFVWPWLSRVPLSPRCRFLLSGAGLCGWTATVVAGRAVVRWCRSFRGVRWPNLVRPSVSVPCLVLWGVVMRRAAPCRVLTCCVVLVCAVLRCALLGRAVLRRVAPWCAAPCRVASRRAVAWYALGCFVVLLCTVVRCGAVCRAASCCAVVGRWRLVWPVSWCGVRVGAWLVGGWGVPYGVGGSLGPCCGGLGVLLGPVDRVGVRGLALPGGLCRGPLSSRGPGP